LFFSSLFTFSRITFIVSMAAKLHFLFVHLGARNTFLWGKKIISMGYFFVKPYGESTSENPLLHCDDRGL